MCMVNSGVSIVVDDTRTNKQIYGVVAIVVTYEPNDAQLLRNLLALSVQVSQVIVVDNGSTTIDVQDYLSKQGIGNITLISLSKNYGIAYAQNRGIEYAKKTNGLYVLLMDQDSLPAPNMVEALYVETLKFDHLAIVGPVYLSQYQNNVSVITNVIGLRRHRKICDENHPIVKSDALIASGTLISIHILNQVGQMNEELFIDYVDTEWGLRAKSLGFDSYVVWRAKMVHQLGNHAINFMGRKMIVHSPFRRYYMYRNAILLYKMKHIPLNWKIVDCSRILLRAVFYSLTNCPRFENFKMILLGLWHGLLGKTGSLK